MKEHIVGMLQESSAPMSGEEMSRHLGVSRVAIWKQINQLKKSGVNIESTAKGYRLTRLPDTPFPWLFGDRSSRIHYYPHLESTMNQASDLARSGCPEYTVVVADRQSRGRGRLQRVWQSEEGGLYFSMIVKPNLTPREGLMVNFKVALELADTLERCCGVAALVKWPNDIVVNDGRKLAGILSQMELEGDQIRFLNLGIGLNLNNLPTAIDKPATSVLQLTGKEVNRATVLADFLDHFEKGMAAFSRDDVLRRWKKKTITLGSNVTVVTGAKTYRGLAVDLDEDGGLIVEMADSSRRTVFYGDCFPQP